ncbi:natriuretic peptides B [Ctenodactylus gundi]
MDPSPVRPRGALLLLLLHLSLGGQSYPLRNPSQGQASEQPRVQEPLDHLRLQDQVSKIPVALELHQQGQGHSRVGETGKADPNGSLQAFWGQHNPKAMRDSGCFRRRLDRIGNSSGLGCNDAGFPLNFSDLLILVYLRRLPGKMAAK